MYDRSDLAWLTARPIAHRGYHDSRAGRPENSLPAFEAAIAHDFAIECDVRLTSDEKLVVFHDATLERLTETSGVVEATPLGVLRAARFKQGGEARIPLLEELLDLADGRVPLVLELKTGHAASGHPLATAVAPVLATYPGDVAVMSFEPETMASLRAAAPHIARGMILDRFTARDHPGLSAAARFALRHLFAAPVVLPRFLAADVTMLPASAPLALHHFFDLPILGWTVRNAEQRGRTRPWTSQIIFEGFDPDL